MLINLKLLVIMLIIDKNKYFGLSQSLLHSQTCTLHYMYLKNWLTNNLDQFKKNWMYYIIFFKSS